MTLQHCSKQITHPSVHQWPFEPLPDAQKRLQIPWPKKPFQIFPNSFQITRPFLNMSKPLETLPNFFQIRKPFQSHRNLVTTLASAASQATISCVFRMLLSYLVISCRFGFQALLTAGLRPCWTMQYLGDFLMQCELDSTPAPDASVIIW